MRGALPALFLLTACAGGAPVRIVADSDTLIVNGPRPVSVGVRATDSEGRIVQHSFLKYASSSGAMRVSNDGHVACVHAGDGVIAVSGAHLRHRSSSGAARSSASRLAPRNYGSVNHRSRRW
jgi:hypothetical protein